MISLKNKTILVTGASSGIGKATAILLSQLGASIILNGRNEKQLNETLQLMTDKNNHQIIAADLTNPNEVATLISHLKNTIDGFAHACGKILPVPVKYIKPEQLTDIMQVNFYSAVTIVTELLKQKKITNKASIVFLSSISTNHAYFGGAPYISSKAALEGYAKTLALELATKKIRVNVLQPALVNTPIFEDTLNATENENKKQELIDKYPLGIGEPIDVAHAIAFFLSDNSKWITGSVLKMDGGLTLGLN